jgi:anti-sigma B factor antagonist
MKRLSYKETDQTLVLSLSGEIIMDLVVEMKAEIEQLTRDAPKKPLILDLDAVTFMDSSGVGLLIGLRRMCLERGTTLTVTNPSPPIKKLLGMLRLTDYFAVPATPPDLPSA